MFSRKKSQTFHFEYLDNSPLRTKYFRRNALWDWMDDTMIYVKENNNPKVIPMNAWHQRIYLDALGKKTVEEYVMWIANLYDQEPIPPALDKSIIQIIEDLSHHNAILTISDFKFELPYYLEFPLSAQDHMKADRLMQKDGFSNK